MSFCKFSTSYLSSGYTQVDNIFITHYMPFAKEEYTKVYLYGLFLCTNMASTNVENFALELDMDIETIKSAVSYWEEQGLIAVSSTSPLEIVYLPIKGSPIKKYKSEKYSDFNVELQNLYPDRQLPQGEYLKYYEFIDDYKMSPDALIMVAKYCINMKGLKVRYPYILAVAKDWALDGIKTIDDVDSRIKEYELNNDTMREIAKAIGKKSAIEMEDKELYTKWTKSWGFDLESIIYAGSFQKKRGGFEKLDKTLDKFFKLGIFTIDAMKSYMDDREKLHTLAVDITSRLGLYYENLDYIIETYISKWLNMGFDGDTLLDIADMCMKSSVKSYEGMNHKVLFFYKNGRISRHAIKEYIAGLIETDKDIKSIIETLGSSRLVNRSDRDYYNTWTNNWGFAYEVVLYVAKICSAKSQSMAYLNNALSRYYEDKRFTIEDIKSSPIDNSYTSKKDEYDINREFTKEELNGLFTSIDDLKDMEI